MIGSELSSKMPASAASLVGVEVADARAAGGEVRRVAREQDALGEVDVGGVRKLLDRLGLPALVERRDAQRPRHLERLGGERRRAHERRARAGGRERGGRPGRRARCRRRSRARCRARRSRRTARSRRRAVVAGLPSKSQPAKAVVSGPPSEWPPQKTFRAPHRPARDLLGQDGVPVAHRLLDAHVPQPVRVRGALPAAEGDAVHRAAAPVVVEGDRGVAGPGGRVAARGGPRGSSRGGRAPRTRRSSARVHPPDEVARELVERPRAAQEARHGRDHGVGVGWAARAAGVAEAQVGHPVARLGVGACRGGQRRLHAHVGLGHLLRVGRDGDDALLGAVGAEAGGGHREHCRDRHRRYACPRPHGAGC